VEVQTYDEDLFDEDIVEYVQAGQIVSAKSFVLFHICQGDDCYYESDDDLFIIDLPTYLANVAQYYANKRNDYCEACDEFEDYCNPEEEEEVEEDKDEEEEDEDEEDDRDGEEEDENEEEDNKDEEGEENQEEGEAEDRKLKKNSRKLTKKDRKSITRRLAKQNIDCDQCQAYQCYVDEEDLDDKAVRQDELDEEVSNWIQELAECKESGVQWNGIDLFLGAMCDPYGDGIELAVFVNEECTMYTNQASFENTFNPYNDNEDGYNYLTYAEEFIKYAFSEVTPCMQQEFNDPDKEDDEDEEEEEEYEMSDYCKEILEGDIADFNNCQPDQNNNDENDDGQYNWYTYVMREADDIDEVCYAVNQMGGEYTYAYDEDSSGSWYERNSKGEIVTGGEDSGNKLELSPGIIAAIVSVSLIVVAGAGFLCFSLQKKKNQSDTSEPVYQGGTML